MQCVLQVRNEAAEDYLQLLKEWQELCQKYPEGCVVEEESEEEDDDEEGSAPGEYEVERLLGIRWIGEVSNKDKEVMEIVDDMEDEVPGQKTPKTKQAKDEEEPPLVKGLEFKVSSTWPQQFDQHATICTFVQNASHFREGDAIGVTISSSALSSSTRQVMHFFLDTDMMVYRDLQVRWKGYTPEHDTWEPSASLE